MAQHAHTVLHHDHGLLPFPCWHGACRMLSVLLFTLQLWHLARFIAYHAFWGATVACVTDPSQPTEPTPDLQATRVCCSLDKNMQQDCPVMQSNRMALSSHQSPATPARIRRPGHTASGRLLLVKPQAAPVAHSEAATAEALNLQRQEEGVLHVYHRSGWHKSVLHGSLCGGPWQDYPLHKLASGKWHRGKLQLPANGNGSGKLLECVFTDKTHSWDKAADGKNYVIEDAGVWTIRDGKVGSVTGKRVMVVSDLDGTMIGDDAATGKFRQWWEDTAVPRGSILVYNTGRALESFQQLLKDKAHCLATPDALISAVGTKVYEFDGSRWIEDAAWQAQLDEGWNLEGVREAAYKALAQAGKDRMHFRPPEEQNNHKVTCGVEVSALQQALDTVNSTLASKSIKANVITSGHGQWRYLDIVSIRAGKLTALNFVRERYGFSPQETVACGDSGNDILMLEGENAAIVVGNAQPDLRNWYQARVAQEMEGNGPDGKQRLLLTSKHEALGILEGLQFWGFR